MVSSPGLGRKHHVCFLSLQVFVVGMRRAKTARMLTGIRILVVDADAAGAKLAAVVLRAAGAKVTVATDAEQALERVDAERPRVLALDLHLPSVSGLVLARILSQLAWSPPLTIVGLATGNGKKLEAEALAAGCAAYFEKPIDERLVQVVSNALGEHR
ncbi:MAG: response regulator [Myxococcaceae bacterium]|nr:response regulator [Myxococcaceae bacterium]